MVESNNHFKDARKTLDRTVAFDRIIGDIARQWKKNSLTLFTAVALTICASPRAPKDEEIVSQVKIDGSHSAEEVLVTAEGPGAERVRGFFPNTEIFHIMMDALGWE